MADIQPFPTAYFRKKFVPIKEANVSIMTHALQYGTGVFGGIRGYQTDNGSISIFRLEDHAKRLLGAINIFGATQPCSREELKQIVVTLIQKNKAKGDIYLRPFIYNSSYGVTPTVYQQPFELAIYMFPLGEYLDIHKGLSVCVSSWTRITDASIPARGKITGGYINSSLARAEANANGFDEAVMLDRNGHVCEGSAENIFIVRNGVLITPPVYTDILEGITRSSILTIAKDLNISVEVRDIDRTELYVADEVFFSGTGVQVSWISRVDHRPVGGGTMGSIAKKLQERFFDIVKGKTAEYKNWRTIVSGK